MKKQSRNSEKKVVSLSIDRALIEKLDDYAAEKKISRSAAAESAIARLSMPVNSMTESVSENSLVQPEGSTIFASPQAGQAILYA